MTKYTVDVVGVYNISVLAPLVELMAWNMFNKDEDVSELELYLAESIPSLISELQSWIGTYPQELDEHPDKWLEIAKFSENLAAQIRQVLEASC